jgi:hypothetical protein
MRRARQCRGPASLRQSTDVRTPTTALLWEIWQRHRWAIGGVAALTLAGRLIDASYTAGPAADEASAVTTLCGIFAFLLLFSVFNYTDSDSGAGLGRFPHRLFTLPVSSLRLVAIPVVTGITAIDLLYLAWTDQLSRGGSTSPLFVAILLAALMVFYLAVLWTCARAGSLRFVIIGVIAAALFAVGLLPSFPPTPVPTWRSEIFLAGLVAALGLVAFMLTWTYVAGVRAGGGRASFRLTSLIDRISDVQPSRRRPFGTAAGAHFWYEWRASGTVLPVVVSGVVLLIIAPTSWLASSDARYTLWLLIGTLATPIVLALPVGVAFSKPTFWSEDLALPAFVAVRPLSSQDLVAIKVKVAAASAALSWLIVLVFLAVWLPLWANLDLVSRLGTRLFAQQSTGVVVGLTVLVPIAGMFLTWRSLVSHLWSGLSGARPLFLVSAFSLVALVTSVVFDVGRLPNWLFGDASRFILAVWVAVIAVVAKCALAAYAWRGATPRHVRGYLLTWFAGTASLLTLGIAIWGLLRMYLPFDVDRVRSAVILLALLAVPLGRVGLAGASLTRNRHR